MKNLSKAELGIGGAALVALILGIVGVTWYLIAGKAAVGYGSYVPWGLWVAVYALLIGASGGAFLVYFLASAANVRALRPLVPIALPVSLAALVGGLLAIWVDLARVERFWHLFVFTNVTSVMGVMVWLYTLFGVLLVALHVLARTRPVESPLMRVLAWIGLVLFIVFGGAEGSLFGVVSAQSLWAGGLTPVMFLFEGALAGAALVLLAGLVFGQAAEGSHDPLRRVLVGLILAVLVLQWAKYSTALYAGVPSTVEAVEAVLFGQYWWVFWLVYGLGGVVAPLALLLFAPRSKATLGVAGGLVATTAIAPKLNLVIPALTVPDFEELRVAYIGPGLSFEYFPTAVEWLVTVGVVAVGTLVFLAALRFLLPGDTAADEQPAPEAPAAGSSV